MSVFRRGRAVQLRNAQVVGQDGVIASSLRIEGGRIGDMYGRPRPADVIIDLGGALVIPGLINAHDHLEHNNFGRLKWRERYGNVRDWIADFQPRFQDDPAVRGPMSVPLSDRLLFGGIKNLLAGVTTVCHHNPLHPELKGGFILRVVQRCRYSHSLLIDGYRVRREYNRTPKGWPWIIHAAEGTDSEAAGELDQLDELGCLGPNTVVVHGVGLDRQGRKKLAAQGGGLVWCPSSNHFLLGSTARVAELAGANRVGLGTDSRLSGERDLLDEMRCALATGQVEAKGVFKMVTVDSASILRLSQAGRLAVGGRADLVIVPPTMADPFASVVGATRSSLRLVVLGGRPQIGDPDMFPIFAANQDLAEKVHLDGKDKVMARAVVDRIRRSTIKEPGLELQN